MNTILWRALPSRFLKRGFDGWCRLDSDVQFLIYELAEKQKFRCALCPAQANLVIDHDHYPEEGPGKPYTKYNVRGLVCGSCNWHLGFYECEANGGYFGWSNAECRVSDREYERYIYAYRCRVEPLVETLLEKRMGSANYWRMRRHHEKFDAWYYDGVCSEWRDRLAEEKARTIDSPEKFFQAFMACGEFVVEQMKKDPTFRPPEKFLEMARQLRSLMRETKISNASPTAESAPVLS